MAGWIPSTTKKLGTAEGEELIRTYLRGKVEGPIGEVRCDETEVKRGAVSGCTALVDGQQLRLNITQDDDEGNVTIVPVQAILDVKQAVALVEQEAGFSPSRTSGHVEIPSLPQSGRLLMRSAGAARRCSEPPSPARDPGWTEVSWGVDA